MLMTDIQQLLRSAGPSNGPVVPITPLVPSGKQATGECSGSEAEKTQLPSTARWEPTRAELHHDVRVLSQPLTRKTAVLSPTSTCVGYPGFCDMRNLKWMPPWEKGGKIKKSRPSSKLSPPRGVDKKLAVKTMRLNTQEDTSKLKKELEDLKKELRKGVEKCKKIDEETNALEKAEAKRKKPRPPARDELLRGSKAPLSSDNKDEDKNKGESFAKKKNYDQNAAREYMNKQKELRKEQRKKELLEKAQAKEMTKQKLKSLQEKRLQLVMAKPKQGNKEEEIKTEPTSNHEISQKPDHFNDIKDWEYVAKSIKPSNLNSENVAKQDSPKFHFSGNITLRDKPKFKSSKSKIPVDTTDFEFLKNTLRINRNDLTSQSKSTVTIAAPSNEAVQTSIDPLPSNSNVPLAIPSVVDTDVPNSLSIPCLQLPWSPRLPRKADHTALQNLIQAMSQRIETVSSQSTHTEKNSARSNKTPSSFRLHSSEQDNYSLDPAMKTKSQPEASSAVTQPSVMVSQRGQRPSDYTPPPMSKSSSLGEDAEIPPLMPLNVSHQLKLSHKRYKMTTSYPRLPLPGNTLEPTVLPDPDHLTLQIKALFDSRSREQAAVKIQAVYRGYKVRKHFQKFRCRKSNTAKKYKFFKDPNKVMFPSKHSAATDSIRSLTLNSDSGETTPEWLKPKLVQPCPNNFISAALKHFNKLRRHNMSNEPQVSSTVNLSGDIEPSPTRQSEEFHSLMEESGRVTSSTFSDQHLSAATEVKPQGSRNFATLAKSTMEVDVHISPRRSSKTLSNAGVQIIEKHEENSETSNFSEKQAITLASSKISTAENLDSTLSFHSLQEVTNSLSSSLPTGQDEIATLVSSKPDKSEPISEVLLDLPKGNHSSLCHRSKSDSSSMALIPPNVGLVRKHRMGHKYFKPVFTSKFESAARKTVQAGDHRLPDTSSPETFDSHSDASRLRRKRRSKPGKRSSPKKHAPEEFGKELPPAALHLQFQAELNMLGTMEQSMCHLIEVEGIRATTLAQQSTTTLAQTLQRVNEQHNAAFEEAERKRRLSHAELEQTLERERNEVARILGEVERKTAEGRAQLEETLAREREEGRALLEEALNNTAVRKKTAVEEMLTKERQEIARILDSVPTATTEDVFGDITSSGGGRASDVLGVFESIERDVLAVEKTVAETLRDSSLEPSIKSASELISGQVTSSQVSESLRQDSLGVESSVALEQSVSDQKDTSMLEKQALAVASYHMKLQKQASKDRITMLQEQQKAHKGLLNKLSKKSVPRVAPSSRKRGEKEISVSKVTPIYVHTEDSTQAEDEIPEEIGKSSSVVTLDISQGKEPSVKVSISKMQADNGDNIPEELEKSQSVSSKESQSRSSTKSSHSKALIPYKAGPDLTDEESQNINEMKPEDHLGNIKLEDIKAMQALEVRLARDIMKLEKVRRQIQCKEEAVIQRYHTEWNSKDSLRHQQTLEETLKLWREAQTQTLPPGVTTRASNKHDMSTSPLLIQDKENISPQEISEHLETGSEKHSNSSIPEDIAADSTRHSNSLSISREQEQYNSESFESPESIEMPRLTINTLHPTLLANKFPQETKTAGDTFQIQTPKMVESSRETLDIRIRAPLSPLPTGKQKRRHSSGSDESIIFSQNASEQSDIEGRVAALREQLRRRKMEADKLQKEQKRLKREKLKAKEQSLLKQIEAYDAYIQQTKEELEQDFNVPISTTFMKPKIKQPRVAEKKPLMKAEHSMNVTSLDMSVFAFVPKDDSQEEQSKSVDSVVQTAASSVNSEGGTATSSQSILENVVGISLQSDIHSSEARNTVEEDINMSKDESPVESVEEDLRLSSSDASIWTVISDGDHSRSLEQSRRTSIVSEKEELSQDSSSPKSLSQDLSVPTAIQSPVKMNEQDSELKEHDVSINEKTQQDNYIISLKQSSSLAEEQSSSPQNEKDDKDDSSLNTNSHVSEDFEEYLDEANSEQVLNSMSHEGGKIVQDGVVENQELLSLQDKYSKPQMQENVDLSSRQVETAVEHEDNEESKEVSFVETIKHNSEAVLKKEFSELKEEDIVTTVKDKIYKNNDLAESITEEILMKLFFESFNLSQISLKKDNNCAIFTSSDLEEEKTDNIALVHSSNYKTIELAEERKLFNNEDCPKDEISIDTVDGESIIKSKPLEEEFDMVFQSGEEFDFAEVSYSDETVTSRVQSRAKNKYTLDDRNFTNKNKANLYAALFSEDSAISKKQNDTLNDNSDVTFVKEKYFDKAKEEIVIDMFLKYMVKDALDVIIDIFKEKHIFKERDMLSLSPSIDVRKRVSEILNDSILSPSPCREKSRVLDLMVTTYDVASLEDETSAIPSDSGSPYKDSFSIQLDDDHNNLKIVEDQTLSDNAWGGRGGGSRPAPSRKFWVLQALVSSECVTEIVSRSRGCCTHGADVRASTYDADIKWPTVEKCVTGGSRRPQIIPLGYVSQRRVANIEFVWDMEIVWCDVRVTVNDSIRDPEPEVVNQRCLLWILELIYSRPNVAGCKYTNLFFPRVSIYPLALITFQIAPKRAPRVLPVVTTTSEIINACRLFLFMTGAMNSNNTQPSRPLFLACINKSAGRQLTSTDWGVIHYDPDAILEEILNDDPDFVLPNTDSEYSDAPSERNDHNTDREIEYCLPVELGGGLSRVAADSEVATDNEGFAQEWFDEDFGLSRTRQEAEDLRLQQLQIEQEASYIQQLQQAQEQLPYYFIREIPNKPPPPYTPPGQTCGAPVPCGQAQVTTFTRQATEHLHAALMTGEGLAMVELPQHFLGSGHQAVFRRFLFDLATRLIPDLNPCILMTALLASECEIPDLTLCILMAALLASECEIPDLNPCIMTALLASECEIPDLNPCIMAAVADAYDWEEPKPCLLWEWPLCSHRKKKLPPRSRDDLHDIVQRQVSQLFGFAPRPGRDNLIVRWSRRKRDCVDDLLMRESHEEEAGWTNYDQDEVTVKNEVTVCILNCLLDETARVFKEIFDKRSARILEP
uniref:CAP-Gly domain-containing protein n=1 Tax=Timema bartmani TaxID=61472 RepID=A0A7R9ENY4_9NEOP|nr:unnamed protein product [Timema bartmani]